MTDSDQQPSDFKDRTPGLVIFGVISILIGACCALLVPLMFLSVALSETVAGGGGDARSAWSASALYAFMAVGFVWLGIGSIRARRWARELLLSLSWIWLLTGICSLVIGVLVVPRLVQEMSFDSGLPPEMAMLMILVIFGVIGVLYVVLPGAFVLFYRSPHVAATCRVRDPKPQWIDECPRRLLTLTVVWVLAAVSVFLMPAYGFFFPLFGVVLTGAGGAILWILVLAVCVALAVGTCRRAPWAWWTGMALALAAALSSILTVLRHDLVDIMVLMELPEEQVSMIAELGMPDGWPMALITGFVWGTFVAYLMTLHRFFEPAPTAADD
jgi:hypothetical protein